LIPLTHMYMTAHFPGLAYALDTSNTHVHDRSLSWLGLGILYL
jgi:hypothetical protein